MFLDPLLLAPRIGLASGICEGKSALDFGDFFWLWRSVCPELMDDFTAVWDILKKCIQPGGSVFVKIGMGVRKIIFTAK